MRFFSYSKLDDLDITNNPMQDITAETKFFIYNLVPDLKYLNGMAVKTDPNIYGYSQVLPMNTGVAGHFGKVPHYMERQHDDFKEVERQTSSKRMQSEMIGNMVQQATQMNANNSFSFTPGIIDQLNASNYRPEEIEEIEELYSPTQYMRQRALEQSMMYGDQSVTQKKSKLPWRNPPNPLPRNWNGDHSPPAKSNRSANSRSQSPVLRKRNVQDTSFVSGNTVEQRNQSFASNQVNQTHANASDNNNNLRSNSQSKTRKAAKTENTQSFVAPRTSSLNHVNEGYDYQHTYEQNQIPPPPPPQSANNAHSKPGNKPPAPNVTVKRPSAQRPDISSDALNHSYMTYQTSHTQNSANLPYPLGYMPNYQPQYQRRAESIDSNVSDSLRSEGWMSPELNRKRDALDEVDSINDPHDGKHAGRRIPSNNLEDRSDYVLPLPLPPTAMKINKSPVTTPTNLARRRSISPASVRSKADSKATGTSSKLGSPTRSSLLKAQSAAKKIENQGKVVDPHQHMTEKQRAMLEKIKTSKEREKVAKAGIVTKTKTTTKGPQKKTAEADHVSPYNRLLRLKKQIDIRLGVEEEKKEESNQAIDSCSDIELPPQHTYDYLKSFEEILGESNKALKQQNQPKRDFVPVSSSIEASTLPPLPVELDQKSSKVGSNKTVKEESEEPSSYLSMYDLYSKHMYDPQASSFSSTLAYHLQSLKNTNDATSHGHSRRNSHDPNTQQVSFAQANNNHIDPDGDQDDTPSQKSYIEKESGKLLETIEQIKAQKMTNLIKLFGQHYQQHRNNQGNKDNISTSILMEKIFPKLLEGRQKALLDYYAEQLDLPSEEVLNAFQQASDASHAFLQPNKPTTKMSNQGEGRGQPMVEDVNDDESDHNSAISGIVLPSTALLAPKTLGDLGYVDGQEYKGSSSQLNPSDLNLKDLDQFLSSREFEAYQQQQQYQGVDLSRATTPLSAASHVPSLSSIPPSGGHRYGDYNQRDGIEVDSNDLSYLAQQLNLNASNQSLHLSEMNEAIEQLRNKQLRVIHQLRSSQDHN
jgi:hypothetical protein